jgi:hypothetical protein
MAAFSFAFSQVNTKESVSSGITAAVVHSNKAFFWFRSQRNSLVVHTAKERMKGSKLPNYFFKRPVK